MNREQVEHILRAAGAITGRREWVIIEVIAGIDTASRLPILTLCV